MSHRATNWAIEQRGLKPATKIVLWHLADRHHPDHGCFPSQDTLAEDCEMSRSTLNVHLKDLENRGLIKRIQRSDKSTKRQKSTYYQLGFEMETDTRKKRVKSKKPCPKSGHGAVSGNGQKPCPENGKSRVRNPDTNPVREPVIKTRARKIPFFTADEEFMAREVAKHILGGKGVRSDQIPNRVKACIRQLELLTNEQARAANLNLDEVSDEQ
jgi:DNA-binding transcriptional ArsR family regulator